MFSIVKSYPWRPLYCRGRREQAGEAEVKNIWGLYEEVTGAGSSVRQSLITNQNNQLYSVRSALSLHPPSSDIYLRYTPSGIYGVH
jgi:hypothetical protein